MTDYPSSLTIRPLTTWPGELTSAWKRKRSPFAASLGTTLGVLERELSAISARNPVLEVAIEPAQFRIDGRPRARATAAHPGVVLSLPTTKVGPLRYATDTFLTWQDNLRAITLGLEALRRVERYGITRRGEQYAGFRALAAADSRMTRTMAEDVINHCAGTSFGSLEERYRSAAKRLHPDVGGDPAAFRRLQEAVEFLRTSQK